LINRIKEEMEREFNEVTAVKIKKEFEELENDEREKLK
jgi:hypothetical protein